MPDFETVAVELDGDVCHIDLDAPERNNVIDLGVILDLNDALEWADRSDDVGGIVLGTTGDTFCSGADLGEIKDLGFEAGIQWLDAYHEMLERLKDTGKPAVAAVRGACVAGGQELVMGCDLIVAGESSRFGQPEVKVGSTAGSGGLQMLPLMVGERRAREMLLLGDLLSAEEAERIGLVNRVVEDGAVEEEAAGMVRTVLEENSPQAYRVMKSIMKGWSNLAMLHWEPTRELTSAVWNTEEFEERAEAFLDRREMEPRDFMGVKPDRDGE